MLYWIIPYLLSYHAPVWEYGPEHVFKAQVHDVETNLEDNSKDIWDMVMIFACRLMFSNTIRCRISSLKPDIYHISHNGTIGESKHKKFCLDQIVFQIEFDEDGMSNISILNNNQGYIHNMIDALMEGINVGIRVAGEPLKNDIALEKSTRGSICNASFTMTEESGLEEEKTEIKDYELLFGPQKNSEHVVITKYRFFSAGPSLCSKPNFFQPYKESDVFPHQKVKKSVQTSMTRFIMSKNSFSTYSVNSGTLTPESDESKGKHIDVRIRISLQFIRPVRSGLWNISNLVDVSECV